MGNTNRYTQLKRLIEDVSEEYTEGRVLYFLVCLMPLMLACRASDTKKSKCYALL